MDGAEPGDEVAADWRIIAEFLRSTSLALGEMPEISAVASGAGVAEIGSAPPAVLRYEMFAELVNYRGVTRLGAAAGAVTRCCDSYIQVVPTAQELEWLISVAAGVPFDDLAERNEVSARSMYRRIEKMWERLGVANQVQGIALAVQQGWIAPPPWGEAEALVAGTKS